MILNIVTAPSESYDYYNSDYDYDDYDYDKGYGYTKPNPGESLDEYIKRQDPELYDTIDRRLKGENVE